MPALHPTHAIHPHRGGEVIRTPGLPVKKNIALGVSHRLGADQRPDTVQRRADGVPGVTLALSNNRSQFSPRTLRTLAGL